MFSTDGPRSGQAVVETSLFAHTACGGENPTNKGSAIPIHNPQGLLLRLLSYI